MSAEGDPRGVTAANEVIVTRPARRRRRGVPAVVAAWLVVLGATVALGIAGRPPADRTAAAGAGATEAATSAPPPTAAPPHTPRPTRPPIGEDGIMGGLPFGTAWEWLRTSRR